MTNNHNVLIIMLRRDFKFLDHLAHSRYDEDVYEPIDDTFVYKLAAHSRDFRRWMNRRSPFES